MAVRRIYKKIIVLTGIIAPLLLIISQAESLWKYSSFFSTHVRNWTLDIYYHSSFGSRRLVYSLLEKHYPSVSLCDRTWEWFDSSGDGQYLDLLVKFQECWNDGDFESGYPPHPWNPAYVAVFVSDNWFFRLVSDFDLLDISYQTAWTEGPFVIRSRAYSSSRQEISIYLLSAGKIFEVDSLYDDFSDDPETRYLLRERRLDIKTFEGYKSYYANELQQKIKHSENLKGLHHLVGTYELSKILEITSEGKIGEKGKQFLKIGAEKIQINTKDEAWGTIGEAELPFFRINRIVTEENCKFSGFHELDGFFGEYVLPPRKIDGLMISCRNKDAETSGMNLGGWSVDIKVIPKEFIDRWQ